MTNIIIECTNTYGKIISTLTRDDLEYITIRTRFHPKGYDKQWKYKHKKWDGFAYTFNVEGQTFRIGLLNRVTAALEHLKYTVTHKWQDRIYNPIDISLTNGIVPYEHQNKIRDLVHKHDIGIISGPCACGKSLMFGIIIDELKQRTLVLTNELVLADQMYTNMCRYFPDTKIGYIGDSEFTLGDITISTVQSLASILGLIKTKNKIHQYKDQLQEWLKDCHIALQDETHLADSDICIAIYDNLHSTYKRFGSTATETEIGHKKAKVANIELEQIFGKVIYSAFDVDYIALGLKVPLLVRKLNIPPKIKVYGTFRDNQAVLYKKCLTVEITDNDLWLATIANTTKEYTNIGSSVFIYAAHSLEYGRKISNLLNIPFINGQTSRENRSKIFDDLYNKRLLAVVSDIGSTGLDVRSLDVIVLATDTRDVRQIAGRVERAYKEGNKQCGTIVDLRKQCSFLNKHAELRDTQYTEMGALVI